MSATGVWFGNEQWPSGASPGAFAKDVFRIENCKSDKQRALAFYTWFQRCMCRGRLPQRPGFDGMLETADPLSTFTWGFHQCTGWGWVAAEALQAAGVKARRAVIHNRGHTIYEVWYAGENAKEGWHAFDPFLGWYLLNQDGEVASCAELAANPDLAVHPRGGPPRFGNHPERSALDYPFHTGDNLDIVQPVTNDSISYELEPGQSYENLWRPELPNLAWGDSTYPRGAHCDVSLFDETGKIRYPEHHPYWRHYVWPTLRTDGIAGGQPVRWQGCGALRWKPLTHGRQAACSAHNAVFENGMLRPAGANKHCEVWWRIRLPYQATYLRLMPVVEACGSDLICFVVSPDAGRSVLPLHNKNGVPPKIITHGPRELPANEPPDGSAPEGPSIRGSREFWLRLDMSSKSDASPLRVLSLGITVGYQFNMQILPRLMPGKNTLFLEAAKLDGAKLQAEWVCTDAQGRSQQVETVELAKSGRAQRTVETNAAAPDDLIMRGVSVRCSSVI
jgi:hypothetical protein